MKEQLIKKTLKFQETIHTLSLFFNLESVDQLSDSIQVLLEFARLHTEFKKNVLLEKRNKEELKNQQMQRQVWNSEQKQMRHITQSNENCETRIPLSTYDATVRKNFNTQRFSDKPNAPKVPLSSRFSHKKRESRSPSVCSQSSKSRYTHVKSKVDSGLKKRISPPPTPRMTQPLNRMHDLNSGTPSKKSKRIKSDSSKSFQKENVNHQNLDLEELGKFGHPIHVLKGKSEKFDTRNF